MKRLATISIIISVIALVISLLHIEPFSITESTYIGIIVSSMGIVFTALVGYQIFNSIEIKKDLQELASKKNDMEETIEKLSEAQRIAEAYNFSNRGWFATSISKYEEASVLFLESLKILLSSKNITPHLLTIDNLITNIVYCYDKKYKDGALIDSEIITMLESIKNLENYAHLTKAQKGKLASTKK